MKIAVLFGINDYADKTIPPLENAVPDVDAVSALFVVHTCILHELSRK